YLRYSSAPPVLRREARSSLITTNRTTMAWIAITCRCQWHHEYAASNLRAHQPMRRRHSRVEQRITCPHLGNIGEAQIWMFKQVRGLRVNFEWIVIVQKVRIKATAARRMSVLHSATLIQ